MNPSRPLRRPLPRGGLVRPAGYANPTFAPGRYEVVAVVEYARGTNLRALPNLGTNLDAALAAAGVGAGRARRAGEVTVAPTMGLGERRVVTYAVPVAVSATIPWRDLARAMNRAVFWGTELTRDGQLVARDPNDGGAYLQALAENYPAEGADTERAERLVNLAVRAAPAASSTAAPAPNPATGGGVVAWPNAATPSRLPLVLGAGALAGVAWLLWRSR